MAWQPRYFGVAEEKSPLAKKVAEEFTFYDFCDFLDNHPTLNKQQFDELLDLFYSRVNTNNDNEDENFSAYSLVRLLMPAKDMRRRLTVRMLRNALELFIHNVQIPKFHSADQLSQFISENYPQESGGLNVYTINAHLKRMVAEPSQRNQIIQECCDLMNPMELKWFFRILFQEISDKACGSTTGRGLVILTNYLSPKAEQLFQAGMDLESICIGIYQSMHNKIDLTNAMILGKPVRPMLLSRIGCNVEDLLTVIKHCRRPFFVETKYDGEHFLLHRLDGGKDYKYFSRRGLEHSDEADEKSLAVFARKLHRHFKSSVENCILDGELVVKDLQTNKIVGKNVENEDGIIFDVKHMKDGNRYRRVFIVFDLLFLNGEEYFEKPLTQRLKALDSLVFQSTDKNAIYISEKKEMSKMIDFQNFYYDHLKKGEEGVVIKGQNTVYNFGQRAANNGWFKVKPDYGPRSVIDVVVVGARYENKDYATIKSFEIAALTQPGQNQRFQIIGGVQARLKAHDFERLVRSLSLKPENTKRPSWIHGVASDRAVRYTDIDHLPVVEVKASGVINNKLQFPVISTLRFDKLADEVCTWEDISEYGKKLRSRKRVFEPEGSASHIIKGKKMRRVIMNSSVHCATKQSNRVTPLKAINVYLVPDFKVGKQKDQFMECEKKLKEFGAELFKNYSNKVALAISPNPKGLRTKPVITKNEVFVISMDWIQRCVIADKVLQWKDSEVIHNPHSVDAFNLSNLDDDEPEPKMEAIAEEPEVSIAVNADTENEDQKIEEPEVQGTEEPEIQDVGAEVDQQIEAEQSMEIDAASNIRPTSPQSTETASILEKNGTLGLEDLDIEKEDERERQAQMRRFDEDEFELPDDLFFGFNMFVPGHTTDDIDANYKAKITKCGGGIVNNLDFSVTHLFFQETYDFDADPHGVTKWLNENQWLAVLTNRQWIDKAICENDRYLDSVSTDNLSG